MRFFVYAAALLAVVNGHSARQIAAAEHPADEQRAEHDDNAFDRAVQARRPLFDRLLFHGCVPPSGRSILVSMRSPKRS